MSQPPSRWIAAGIVVLGIAAAPLVAQTSIPILEYRFNAGAGAQAFSTGSSQTPAWLLASRTEGGAPTSLWGEGVSGEPADFAFDNRLADEGMGVGTGGWIIGDVVKATNDLHAFTVTGWMRYETKNWGSHGAIYTDSHGKTGLAVDLAAKNRLRVFVNGESTSTPPGSYDAAAAGWTFFAVSYNAQEPAGNVRFYLGSRDRPVQLVDTQTLAAGPVAGHERPFIIGAAAGGSRPFAGSLDNLRVFGSAEDAAGALSHDEIEQIRRGDLANPAAATPLPEIVASPVKGEIVEVNKIWHEAPHTAFPDLVRFKDRWICSFREASQHKTTAGGAVCIITSEDGRTWEKAARFTYEGEDVRELHFAVTPQGSLVAVGASADMTTPEPPTHRSYAWISEDGLNWSERQVIPAEQDVWLWRATLNEAEGALYGGAYYCDAPRGIDLYRSTDGVNWQRYVEKLATDDFPSESDIAFLDDGRAVMLLRHGRGGRLGVAAPPYTDWAWKDLDRRIAAPDLLQLPDGRLIVAVRLWEGGTRTALCWVDPERGELVEFLTLPSKPDTGYAGLQWHDGHLWAAYYSDPEGETSIYFAKIRIE